MKITWKKHGLGNRQLILEILQFAEMYKRTYDEYPEIYFIYKWFEDICGWALCEAIIGAIYDHKLAKLDELHRFVPLIEVEVSEEEISEWWRFSDD